MKRKITECQIDAYNSAIEKSMVHIQSKYVDSRLCWVIFGWGSGKQDKQRKWCRLYTSIIN